MSWICPNCFEENEDISKFCIFCSTKKPEEKKENAKKTISNNITENVKREEKKPVQIERQQMSKAEVAQPKPEKILLEVEENIISGKKEVEVEVQPKKKPVVKEMQSISSIDIEKVQPVNEIKKEQIEEKPVFVKEINIAPQPIKEPVIEEVGENNKEEIKTTPKEEVNEESCNSLSKLRRGVKKVPETMPEGLSDAVLKKVQSASQDAIENSKISTKPEKKRNKKKASKFFAKPLISVFGNKKKETEKNEEKEVDVKQEDAELQTIDSESGLKNTRELHMTLGNIPTQNLCVITLGIIGYEKNFSINLELTPKVVSTMGACVKKTFGEECCYRASKDKIVVLLEDTTIIDADKSILKLKKNVQAEMDATDRELYISFAVGMVQGSASSSPKALLQESYRLLEEDKMQKEMISPNERKENGELYIPNHDGYYNDVEPIPEDYQREFASETIRNAILLVVGTIIGLIIFELMI